MDKEKGDLACQMIVVLILVSILLGILFILKYSFQKDDEREDANKLNCLSKPICSQSYKEYLVGNESTNWYIGNLAHRNQVSLILDLNRKNGKLIDLTKNDINQININN